MHVAPLCPASAVAIRRDESIRYRLEGQVFYYVKSKKVSFATALNGLRACSPFIHMSSFVH